MIILKSDTRSKLLPRAKRKKLGYLLNFDDQTLEFDSVRSLSRPKFYAFVDQSNSSQSFVCTTSVKIATHWAYSSLLGQSNLLEDFQTFETFEPCEEHQALVLRYSV